MTALAVQSGAVNLGQGFPDFDGPATLLETAREAIANGVNQYPPGPGNPELRAAIAEQRTRYGTEFDPDTQVLVTVGATEAIASCLLALVEQGDGGGVVAGGALLRRVRGGRRRVGRDPAGGVAGRRPEHRPVPAGRRCPARGHR